MNFSFGRNKLGNCGVFKKTMKKLLASKNTPFLPRCCENLKNIEIKEGITDNRQFHFIALQYEDKLFRFGMPIKENGQLKSYNNIDATGYMQYTAATGWGKAFSLGLYNILPTRTKLEENAMPICLFLLYMFSMWLEESMPVIDSSIAVIKLEELRQKFEQDKATYPDQRIRDIFKMFTMNKAG